MKLIPGPILYAYPVRTDRQTAYKDRYIILLFIIVIAVVKNKIKVVFRDYDTHTKLFASHAIEWYRMLG